MGLVSLVTAVSMLAVLSRGPLGSEEPSPVVARSLSIAGTTRVRGRHKVSTVSISSLWLLVGSWYSSGWLHGRLVQSKLGRWGKSKPRKHRHLKK